MTRFSLLLAPALGLALAGCGDRKPSQPEPTAVDQVDAANAMGPAASAPAAPAAPGMGAGNAADPVDLSNWDALERAVGRYPAEIRLYEASVLTQPLKTLLGDDYDDFVENMGVSGPLSKDGVLFATGNKPHEGGSDAAFILIDPAARKLEVGLWEDGKFKSYASPGALMNRPADVKTMVGNMRAAAGAAAN